MKLWKELNQLKELSKTQKILLGMLVIAVVMLIPESAFLLDVGGIDLLLFILLFYGQNMKQWFDLHFGFINYPNIGIKTFVTRATLSSALMFVTGSVVLAYGFFLVVMFLGGV